MTGSDNARMRPVPGFRQVGTGQVSSWECAQCKRRLFTMAGRSRWRGMWRCAGCAKGAQA